MDVTDIVARLGIAELAEGEPNFVSTVCGDAAAAIRELQEKFDNSAQLAAERFAETIKLSAELRALAGEVEQWKEWHRNMEALRDKHSASVDSLIAERDTLRAEVAALRKDAERYRWLKSLGGCVWDVACPDGWRSTYHRHDQMDAAIDAALADKPLSGPTP